MIVGIDSGSTMCKAVLFDGNEMLDAVCIKTGWNPKLSARESLDTILQKNAIDSKDILVATTGYGRESIDFAQYSFTEITCHALGGVFLEPDIQGIIDIGGQDSKVIQIRKAKAANFLMNDKCAAGTGRFLRMACDKLEIPMNTIDQFVDSKNFVPINSMCAVFAESEIIGLLSTQVQREKILMGVLLSIAGRVSQMVGRLDVDCTKPYLMTGGLACSRKLAQTIAKAINTQVKTHDFSNYAGALGACIGAFNKQRTE